MVANVAHPLHNARSLSFDDVAGYGWVVYRANMPMRVPLEREFSQAGVSFPTHLLETTSAFATLSLLQENSGLLALVSTDVASFCVEHGLTCILPLSITSRGEPYELVTRRGAPLSVGASLLKEMLAGIDSEREE